MKKMTIEDKLGLNVFHVDQKYGRTLVISVMSYLSSPSGETIKYSQHI